MIRQIEPVSFLEQSSLYPVVDVRAPGEYFHGHVPGAFSIPVFEDAGRAEIGTIYVQKGREYAVLRGLDLALPRVEHYLGQLRSAARGQQKILVHCWRGGLRSQMMAEVFSRAGYEVSVLAGGYKSYRKCIRERLGQPARIIILGGYTGSGKTELLHALAAAGEQVLDLEGLACHKGSVFGAFGQPVQPTGEQFENDLYSRWAEFDVSRNIWVEDESRMIGRITLPDPVVAHLSAGTLIRVDMDLETRINRLVQEYACFDRQLLADAIRKIAERLGGALAGEALRALEAKDFKRVAGIVLAYYDKAYLHSISRRPGIKVHDFRVAGTNFDKDARRLVDFVHKLTDHESNIS